MKDHCLWENFKKILEATQAAAGYPPPSLVLLTFCMRFREDTEGTAAFLIPWNGVTVVFAADPAPNTAVMLVPLPLRVALLPMR